MWNMPPKDFTAFAVAEAEKIGIIDRRDVMDTEYVRVKKAYPAYFGSYAGSIRSRAF
jgi:protoporphyrinogen oxidase